MKQILNPDHIAANNFQLVVVGGPPFIKFITVDGLEPELDTVDLPDRTKASGGAVKPVEFTATHPKHEFGNDLFLHNWFELECQDPVSPTYKKAGTLIVQSISRIQTRTFQLIGLFPMKFKTMDLDMGNEGDMNVTEWTFSVDRVLYT